MKKYLTKKNPQASLSIPGANAVPSTSASQPSSPALSDSNMAAAAVAAVNPLSGLVPGLMRSNSIPGLTPPAHATMASLRAMQSIYPSLPTLQFSQQVAANLFRLAAAQSLPQRPANVPAAAPAPVSSAGTVTPPPTAPPVSSPRAPKTPAASPQAAGAANRGGRASSAPRGGGNDATNNDATEIKSEAPGSTPTTPSSARRGQPYIPSYMDLSNGPEPCVVCGDAATGYHYRCMTCEGCKGFFRRTIQKSLQYHCKWAGHCIIDKNTRNQCQKCRFEKCITVGMATDLVLNERQRLAKRKLIEENRARRRQEHVRMRSRGDGTYEEILTDEDIHVIDTIRKAYEDAVRRPSRGGVLGGDSVSVGDGSAHSGGPSGDKDALRQLRELPEANRLTNTMTPAIIKVVDFAKSIPDFIKLSLDDQIVLLKASCLEIMCLRTASRFCKETGTLPLRNGMIISRDDLETLVKQDSSATLYEPIFEFAYNLAKLELDGCEVALLAATLVTQTDRSGLKNDAAVERIQDQILSTFKRYVAAQRPEHPLHWAKIIMKVTDLRSICQVHAERVLLNSLETSSQLMPSFLALFGESDDFVLTGNAMADVALVPMKTEDDDDDDDDDDDVEVDDEEDEDDEEMEVEAEKKDASCPLKQEGAEQDGEEGDTSKSQNLPGERLVISLPSSDAQVSSADVCERRRSGDHPSPSSSSSSTGAASEERKRRWDGEAAVVKRRKE